MTKLFTTLLIALGTTLFAQDQVAKDVLDRLSSTTKSYKNMTVDFDFIFENKNQNINEKQKELNQLTSDFKKNMKEYKKEDHKPILIHAIETYKNTNGFFTEYSMTTPSEDMAEVYSHLISGAYKISNDTILNQKIKYIKDKLNQIDSNFEF